MNWTLVFIVVVVFAVYLALKRSGEISVNEARVHMKNGALLIDVRTAGEYDSGHLPSAINIPLDEIEVSLPRHEKDKNQVILLHCQSGTRSGVAKRRLNRLGYANAFNLGSYARAEQIVNGK
jgi:phage shock protein E